MLRIASNRNKDGISLSPFAYDLNEAKLILRDGEEIQLQNVISKIKIVESIQRVATVVNISIIDTHDFLDVFRLDGTEKIYFKITRNEPDQEKRILERTVTIASIVDYQKPNPSTLTYTLSCVPEYAYLNQYKTISKRVSGSTKKNIFVICNTDLKIEGDFIGFDSRGSTNFDAIIPIMKPLSAINWLLRNADNDGTPYYFYQTANGMVRCKSKVEMNREDIHETYNNIPYFENSVPDHNSSLPEIKAYYDELKKKIAIDRSEIKMSKYTSGAEGAYGSTIHHLDISTKKYKPEPFNFNKKNLLNKFQPIGKDSKIANQNIDKLTTGKNNFYSTNDLAFSNNGTGAQNYHHNAKSKAIANTNSHKALHDITSQRFEIPGDFDLEAGSIINLDLLRVAEKEDSMPEKSDYLNGKHLVTSIEHHFTRENYKMVVSAKKDSFIKSLDDRPIELEKETKDGT
tara:strand:- start:320 stop:1693 length:1374 start_codon:yes stop_codon:yes gene_type:complete